MASKIAWFACFCLAFVFIATSVYAQDLLINYSFEEGLYGWTPYTYQPDTGEPEEPVAGCVGDSSCQFNVLIPSSVPDGQNVCGIQSSGETGNGGVYQTFYWYGSAGTISVTARAFSEKYDYTSMDNGCRVRMGLVNSSSQSRDDVTSWVTFPWSSNWNTRSVSIPGPGTYTLFIESYQPNTDAIMSTLWDNAVFEPLPDIPITTEPTATVPGNSSYPDTSVSIQWTTGVPCSTKVEYGLTSSYGQVYEDDTPVTQHVAIITGLTHSQLYYYHAKSSAEGYLDWTSDNLTFETPIRFQDIGTKISSDGKDIIVYWTTDLESTSQVEYWLDGTQHVTTNEDTNPVTYHEVTISGLAEESEYHFQVWSKKSGYSDASSDEQTFFTLPAPGANLRNPSFEEGHGNTSPSLYPWVQYTLQIDGFHPIDGIVGPYPDSGSSKWFADIQAYDGSYFIGAGANTAYKNGGVFQRIYVTPGDPYTFTAHYATYRVGGMERDTRVKFGIDPNGGVDPLSDDIVWWSGSSYTNDDQWHPAAITAVAGSGGVATVFIDMRQRLPTAWHVIAADEAAFTKPVSKNIGDLKSAKDSLGATLENKTVTYVHPYTVTYGDADGYTKVYIEEDNRTSGIAVLFPPGATDIPDLGNKITVTGTLSIYNKEAVLIATSWTVDRGAYTIAPLGISQSAIRSSAENQPSLFGTGGACTIGLKVRVWGKVNWASIEGFAGYDVTAYIDDGTGVADKSGTKGIRTCLCAKVDKGVNVGDYIWATGVLSVEQVDPDSYPGDDDEYQTYTVLTCTSDDWDVISSSSASNY